VKITPEEVDHIAMLARLALTADERDRMRDQLGQIIGYVEMMNQLDTSQVPPSAQVLAIENVTRPDIARPGFPVDVAVANAPERVEDFFGVPPVLEDE
jgi:aspartyl-tRNA(Asn)/glutamyl-tRNA(Gln) amidotransferase subunit C